MPQNKIKKIFLMLLVVYLFFAHTAVFAAEGQPVYSGVSSQIKQYLCAPTEASKDVGTGANTASSDLYKCINQLYKFCIALGGSIAVFFVVVAGYIYMSSDGNQESVDKAKDILVSSITAMVILLGGYILLKAINPDLIEFKPIQPPSVKLDTSGWNDWQTSKNSEGSGGGPATLIGAKGPTGCSNCTDYTQAGISGNSTQKSGQNTFLSQGLVDKLKQIRTTYPNFIVNEAFPPTVNHASGCHFNGTCVDVGINNKTPAELDKLCQAAKNAGLSILNEYGNYKASDFKVCPAPRTYSTTTGGHLHLY